MSTGIAGRNAGLDLARAAAILMVVASHITSYGFALSPHAAVLIELLGGLGVELFFSLSGFLIGRILLRLAADLHPPSVGGFLVRRWLRTLPLYYAVLVFSCWMFQRLDLPAFAFLQTIWPREATLLPQSWSLVLEEFFYFSFPVIMLVLPAGFGSGVTRVGRVAWLLIVLAMLVRAAVMIAGVDFDFRSAPLLRFDCAAYGVLAACLDARRRGSPPGGAAGAMAATVSMILIFAWWPVSEVLRVLEWPTFDAVFAWLVWSLFYHVRREIPGALLLSRLSYSIYLVHLLILAFLLHPLFDRLGALAGVFVVLGIILGVSALTWLLIEQPFLWVRGQLSKRVLF